MTDEARLATLTREVSEALGEDHVQVRAWRAGVDFWADLAYRGDEVLGVVRTPRYQTVQTRYEGTVDFGAVIEKEVLVLGLLASHGVPVPAVHGWRRGRGPDGLSWLLCDHVEHEPTSRLTPELQQQLGRIARTIHSVTTDAPQLLPAARWPTYVIDRLRSRLTAASKYFADLPIDELLRRAAPAVVPRRASATSLLHMDLRAANLCIREGRIVAVIDVANAIVGDPLLELARIRSYGLLTEAFCAGYETSPEELGRWRMLLDVYELDTAALLTVVAMEEAADADLYASALARTEELTAALLGAERKETTGEGSAV
jgi:aminoglycoside phosphotransferase (APT) family kinase protein